MVTITKIKIVPAILWVAVIERDGKNIEAAFANLQEDHRILKTENLMLVKEIQTLKIPSPDLLES